MRLGAYDRLPRAIDPHGVLPVAAVSFPAHGRVPQADEPPGTTVPIHMNT